MPRRLLAVLLLALPLSAAPSCGSDARAIDACKRLESARCTKARSCPAQFPDITNQAGVDSCTHFYEVQCGRGVQDAVKDPSRGELDACLGAIQASCDVAYAPESSPACAFLTANNPPPSDTGTESGADTGASAEVGDAADSSTGG